MTFLYLKLLPKLPREILIHIHDIYLPYEYPKDWFRRQWYFNEQYLIQGLLTHSNTYEVLWAGHYLQRNRKDFEKHFLHLNGGVAGSLRLRKLV